MVRVKGSRAALLTPHPPKATLALSGGEGGVVRDGFVSGVGGGGVENN